MSKDIDAGQGARPRWHCRQVGAALVVVVALSVLAAACGGGSAGPGVAGSGATNDASSGSGAGSGSGSGSGGSGGSGSGGSGGSNSFNALAYSQCMRSHGVADFPDPNSQGQINISAQPGSDLDPGSPTFQAAMKACAKYAPGGNLTPAQKAQQQAALLKFSKCMRKHGISDFPDPSNGGLALKSGPGSDLDPNSAAFQNAQKACQSNLPGFLKGGGGIRFSVGGGAGPGKEPGSGGSSSGAGQSVGS